MHSQIQQFGEKGEKTIINREAWIFPPHTSDEITVSGGNTFNRAGIFRDQPKMCVPPTTHNTSNLTRGNLEIVLPAVSTGSKFCQTTLLIRKLCILKTIKRLAQVIALLPLRTRMIQILDV